MDTGKILMLGGVAVGGYLLYSNLFATTAPATGTAPAVGTSGGAPAGTFHSSGGGTLQNPKIADEIWGTSGMVAVYDGQQWHAPPLTTAEINAITQQQISVSNQTLGPPPTISAPPASFGSLANMKTALYNAALPDQQFTGTGDSLSGTPYHWGFYLQRVLQPGSVIDLPAALQLTTVFPGVDLTQPMTLADFWARMGPAVAASQGLSGFLRGLGAYMGLGDALPLCTDITVDPGFVGPVNCDSSQGGVDYPASQSQVENLAQQVQSLIGSSTSASGTGSGVASWLNQNATMVMVGAAALVGFAIFTGGGGRR